MTNKNTILDGNEELANISDTFRELRDRADIHFDHTGLTTDSNHKQYYTITKVNKPGYITSLSTTGVTITRKMERTETIDNNIESWFSQDEIDGITVVINEDCINYDEHCIFAYVRDIDAHTVIVGEYIPFDNQALTVDELAEELRKIVESTDAFDSEYDNAVESAKKAATENSH